MREKSEQPITGSSARPELPLAVIIGAGAMGMAIARRLGERNRLLIVDRDSTRLEHVMVSLRSEGHDARSLCGDITDAAALTELSREVAAQGPMRVLAHVTALAPKSGDWRAIMTVNLTGAARVAEALLPHATQSSAAIFISSVGAHFCANLPNQLISVLSEPLSPDFLKRLAEIEGDDITPTRAYILSKFGLNKMCRDKVRDWAAHGARIVSVSPGLIDTPMGALEYEGSPRKYQLLKDMPLGREGTILEIADAVEFLASNRASFITGTDLLVDGGTAAVT